MKKTLEQVEGYLAASGRVPVHGIGEPTSPPETDNVAGFVFMSGVSVAQLYLNGGTLEVHTVTLRLQKNWLQQPTSQVETELAQAVSEISSDLFGDYDLGASIREIDIAGQYGTPVSVRWGRVDISGNIYRAADMTIPLVVDDSATASP